MPLIKSKSPKAFKHNVEAEMEAGKPQKQALAIAYSQKKRAKKMAKGGQVEEVNEMPVVRMEDLPDAEPLNASEYEGSKKNNEAPSGAIERYKSMGMQDEPEPEDLFSRIHNSYKKMQAIQQMSKGGMVANDVGVAEADRDPAEYDDLVLRDDLEDDSSAGNEHGEHPDAKVNSDIIHKILMKHKGRMPRPA